MQKILVKKEDYLLTVLDNIEKFLKKQHDELPAKQLKIHIQQIIDIARESVVNEYDNPTIGSGFTNI